MDGPIRIYIGTEPKTRLAEKVLIHSIRRNTTAKIEFTAMIGHEWEYPLDGLKVGTGFSLRRWMIPAARGFRGRAIYIDADQLVLKDVRELWDYPDTLPSDVAAGWMTFQPSKFWNAKNVFNSSVMVIDCKRADNFPLFHIEHVLDYLRKFNSQEYYAQLMYPSWMEAVRIPTCWNHLNVFVPPDKPKTTRLLHYTKEPEQPWYKPDHPLAYLWQAELEATIKERWITKEEFEAALSQWNKKEDWRSTNGLHPWYKRYLPLFNRGAA